MRRWRIILSLLSGAALLPPGPGTALQVGDGVPSPERSVADSALWTGTHEVEVRWLHARQRPELTRFETSRITFHFVGVAAAGDRHYAVRTCCPVRRGSLRIGDGGELLESWVEPPDFAEMLGTGRNSHTIGFASRHLAPRGAAMLDDSRLWDIAPLRPPAPRAGSMTHDTLRSRAERFGFLQSVEGPRVTTLLRDTVVEGRRLWIGRDSARVRYRERVLHWRRSLHTTVVVAREAAGTLRGRFLYDPDLGLFEARWDTLVAAGEATLRLPDGTLYRTPASYERRSAWTLRSPEEQRAWDEAERDRRRRHGHSMVRFPNTPLEERVSAGDTGVADSLLHAWRRSGPPERRRIREALAFAPPSFRERLDSLIVAEAGWISEVGRMTRRVWAGPPVDGAEMVEYLKLLRDPSIAFDHGIDPDPAYENLAGGLVMYPPTLGAPPGRTSCTPAACRLVAAEGNAREPRLRKVALVARFILEPERWVDSLLSRTDTASHLLRDAVLLARGVGATWESAEKRPIPPPGATWREWRRWTGVDGTPGMGHGPPPLVRFGDSHLYAIRMTERLTGRDIGAELATAADTSRTDSARAVFRALALRVGSVRPTVAELIPDLRSPDQTERQLAFAALRQHTADRRPAAEAVAEEVVGQLLAQAIDGDSIWTAGPEGRPPVRRVHGDSDSIPARPLFLARENLPDGVRTLWERRDGVDVITHEEWRGQPPRQPGVLLAVGEVTALGPLVWVSLDRWVREERAADESPRGWASGERFLLLRTEEGWEVLSVGEWIT